MGIQEAQLKNCLLYGYTKQVSPQNTSLQQLRQVQQPRYVQQQVHQQRLNNQYTNNNANNIQQQQQGL